MSIQVRFFASLREHVGRAESEITETSVSTVRDVWDCTTNNMALPENTLMAVNMEYVDAMTLVKKDDEVAFFPPVTGG